MKERIIRFEIKISHKLDDKVFMSVNHAKEHLTMKIGHALEKEGLLKWNVFKSEEVDYDENGKFCGEHPQDQYVRLTISVNEIEGMK